MATIDEGFTVAELAARVDGRVDGDPSRMIRRPVSAGTADPEGITFATSPEIASKAGSVPIGAIVVGPFEFVGESTRIVATNARAAFGAIVQVFEKPPRLDPGTDPRAYIHPTAQVASSASIGPFVYVGAFAVVEDNAKVHPGSYVGDRCRVGHGSQLMPRSTLVQDVRIGKNCLIHSGAVLGADGFGIEMDGGRNQKIPQVGGVVLGDEVEVGANSCIDRGALEDTVVGDRVKMDNLCQIGHNAHIGAGSIIVAMVGIGGSAKLGEQVVLGADVGVNPHVTIASGTVVAGKSGVTGNIDAPGEYLGYPAIEKGAGMRAMALQSKLPEMWRRLQALEKSIREKPEA